MKKKEIVFVSRIIHAFVFVKIVSKDIIITRNIHAYVYFYLLFLKKKERIDTLWIIRRRRGELPPQQRHESSGIDVLERGESVMETIKNKKKFFALRKAPYIAISLSHTHTRALTQVLLFSFVDCVKNKNLVSDQFWWFAPKNIRILSRRVWHILNFKGIFLFCFNRNDKAVFEFHDSSNRTRWKSLFLRGGGEPGRNEKKEKSRTVLSKGEMPYVRDNGEKKQTGPYKTKQNYQLKIYESVSVLRWLNLSPW